MDTEANNVNETQRDYLKLARSTVSESIPKEPRPIGWQEFQELDPDFHPMLAELKNMTSSYISTQTILFENQIKAKFFSVEMEHAARDTADDIATASAHILKQLQMRDSATIAVTNALFDGIFRMIQYQEQAFWANIDIIYLHNHIRFSQKTEKLLRQETTTIVGEHSWNKDDINLSSEDLLVAELLRVRDQVKKLRGTRLSDLQTRLKEQQQLTSNALEQLKNLTELQHQKTVEILKLKDTFNILQSQQAALKKTKTALERHLFELRRRVESRTSEEDGIKEIELLKQKITDLTSESARKSEQIKSYMESDKIECQDPSGIAIIRMEREIQRLIEECERLEN